MKDLGEFIKLKRKEKKLTLIQLAKITNLTQGYLSNIERNSRMPSIDTLRSIAQALNIDNIELYWRAGYYTDLEYFEAQNQEKVANESLHGWDEYAEHQIKKEEYEQFKQFNYPDLKDFLDDKSKTYFNRRLLDQNSKKLISKILHAIFDELEENYPSDTELEMEFKREKKISDAMAKVINKKHQEDCE